MKKIKQEKYKTRPYERIEVEVLGQSIKEIMRIADEIVAGERNPIWDRRDWLLGGEMSQWGYYKDPTTNELVLERW